MICCVCVYLVLVFTKAHGSILDVTSINVTFDLLKRYSHP